MSCQPTPTELGPGWQVQRLRQPRSPGSVEVPWPPFHRAGFTLRSQPTSSPTTRTRRSSRICPANDRETSRNDGNGWSIEPAGQEPDSRIVGGSGIGPENSLKVETRVRTPLGLPGETHRWNSALHPGQGADAGLQATPRGRSSTPSRLAARLSSPRHGAESMIAFKSGADAELPQASQVVEPPPAAKTLELVRVAIFVAQTDPRTALHPERSFIGRRPSGDAVRTVRPRRLRGVG